MKLGFKGGTIFLLRRNELQDSNCLAATNQVTQLKILFVEKNPVFFPSLSLSVFLFLSNHHSHSYTHTHNLKDARTHTLFLHSSQPEILERARSVALQTKSYVMFKTKLKLNTSIKQIISPNNPR